MFMWITAAVGEVKVEIWGKPTAMSETVGVT